MMAPEPRKRRALNQAWVKRWNMPASAREEADGHDHIAELGEGGVGEDFFDVVLLGGHEGGEEGGDAADPGDGAGGKGELGIEWVEADEEARHHVDTGGDHGGGVDEGGDGGGTFHGVGQPDVEWGLGGLADGAGKEAEDGGAEEGGGDFGVGGSPSGDAVEGEGGGGATGDLPEEEDADHEAEVADAVGKEGFFGGICGGVFMIPMTDEEVGTESDEFPEDEGHDEVRGEDDAGHGEHEEGESAEVAGLGFVILHVVEREEVDEESDAGDDDHHAFCEGVELEADVDGEIADGGPLEWWDAGITLQEED